MISYACSRANEYIRERTSGTETFGHGRAASAYKEAFPSLYLNIAQCYENLNDPDNEKRNYDLALSFTGALPADGYGNMIKNGIMSGIERLAH